MTPRLEAQRIVAKYGTRDPFTLADYMDVPVLTVDPSASIDGAFVRDSGWCYIGLREGLSPPHKRMGLAHELGHLVCHTGINYFFVLEHTFFPPGRYERQANEFAAEYLIPDDALSIHSDIRLIAAELDVPVELFRYKRPPRGGLICM